MNGIDVAVRAAYAAGFRGDSLLMAVAIAGAESNYNSSAVGDVALGEVSPKWDSSIGLWQIRSLESDDLYLEPIRDKSKLFDPYYNAQAAWEISDEGTDWSPWSTYTSGAYYAYQDKAIAAIAAFNSTSGPLVAEVKKKFQ